MTTASAARARRNPAPLILLGVVVLLAIYYVVVAVSGALAGTTQVEIRGQQEPPSDTYLTVQMRVQEIDLTNRTMQATVLPIPSGDLVGARPGEVSEGVRIEIVSGGYTTSVVTFPGESIVDPTSLTLSLDRGDSAYPFDQPFAAFQLSVTSEDSGDPVAFVLDTSNSARPWVLSAQMGDSVSSEGRQLYPLTFDGMRDPLTITLVAFYVLAILITTLMAVVTIGSALIKQSLEFANVIWLSATMLSFPALRGSMPGAPPIGTALDFIVLFPCIVLIAIMLVWTGAFLLWRESHLLRRRTLDDGTAASAAQTTLVAGDD